MVQKEFVRLDLAEIHPYENNPRINDDAVDDVLASIEQCGDLDPIEVDENNVVLSGHTRLKALTKRGDKSADVIRFSGLTEEQKKKYRILTNKTGEKALWDFGKLSEELDGIDFDGFDFGIDEMIQIEEDAEIQHEINREIAHARFTNIENLNKGQYLGEGLYDIPILDPVFELPPIKRWIDFDHVLREQNPEGVGVHFFIHDYKFQRLWVSPERYVDKLKRFAVVATPDFSPYGDMPHALQIYNHYRKHWVGKFLQKAGVTVIPTIRCSTDPRSFDWYLDGEPHGGIVMISSMWTDQEATEEISKREYETMKRVLKPKKIFIYGNKTEHMGVKKTDPVEYVDYVHNLDF